MGKYVNDINTLLKEIKSYSEDTILSKLTEQEAAKRLAIGTTVGKYHTVAMKLKGLTVEYFEKSRNYFGEIY